MRMRIFRDYDDREGAALFFAFIKQSANTREFERVLGNKNGVGAARHTTVRRDPSRVAAHHFDYHYAVMGLGCRMQTVNCVGNDRDGGVETEGEIRSVNVVVDGLGNSDQLQL